MTNQEFGEFYNQNYRAMPEDFYPEIEPWRDENGVWWRKTVGIDAFGYVETAHNRADGDESLRRLEWNRLELVRIKLLAGIE